MNKEERKNERPESYPKPTKTEKQVDSQDEFIQPQSDKKNNEAPILKDESEGKNDNQNS